jgi:hypothetical protein
MPPQTATSYGASALSNNLPTVGELIMRAATASIPGAEFNEFLFAPIGEDRNGMLVSVLSALARLDVDPWLEAAKLAQLPGETATQRLASLIDSLNDRDTSSLDPTKIAARLIALLPRQAGSNNRSHDAPHDFGATIKSKSSWIYVIFMCFVLGTQFVIASSQQRPIKADSIQAQTSSTVSARTALVNSGQ